MSVNLSKDGGSVTSDAIIRSVPSQSSEVAEKILQQMDKFSPSPMEKLSERRPIWLKGKIPFTLTPDMLTGQALRSLEDIDPSILMDSFQENCSLNDSVQRVTTIEDHNTTNGKNQIEENVPKKKTSLSNTGSKTAFDASDRPLRDERTFQMSAHVVVFLITSYSQKIIIEFLILFS